MDSYQEATEEDTGGREHVVLFFGIVRSRQRRQASRRDAQLITNKRFHQAHQHHCAQTASVDDAAPDPSQGQQLLGLSAMADLHLHLRTLRKGQRRNLSRRTTLTALLLAAARKHNEAWNHAARLVRPDFLEVCAARESPLVQAIESAGGEGLRASSKNGYDMAMRRDQERCHLLCASQRPRYVCFSPPCNHRPRIQKAKFAQ